MKDTPKMENLLGIIDPSESDSSRKPKKNKRPASNDGDDPQPNKKNRGESTPDPRFEALRESWRQKQERKEEQERRKICVGVDFGTTCTGAAYVSNANTSKPPEVIVRWGRGSDALLQKTPTIIAYANENPKFDGEDRVGCDVKPGTKSYSWFKLLLDDAVSAADYDDPLLKKVTGSQIMTLAEGKTAQEVVTDYFERIYDHIINHLDGILGGGLLLTPLLFCVTVPATWSRAAREATRQAAVDAGFGSRANDELIMTDEPQAGIIDVLHSTLNGFNQEQQSFQKNTCVLCCDMGGGTIDLITYRIAGISPLRIEEAAVGAGAKSGGTSIDREFWKWCQDKFDVAFNNVLPKYRATGSKMMTEFEELKQRFQGTHVKDQEKEMFVTLRMSDIDMKDEAAWSRYDEDEDSICITSQEMQSFFEPVLKSTFALIRDQINRARNARKPKIECLVLCGGLSNSPYVQYRIREFIEEELDNSMQVIIPEQPTAAIARGAAIHAREQKIVLFRKARDSLGIVVHKAFEEGVHDEEDKAEIVGVGTRAMNQMHWSIRRAQKIRPGTRSILKCAISLPLKKIDFKKPIIVYQDIYASPSEPPPERLDDSCGHIGRLKMNLTKAALARRNELRKESQGKTAEVIDFNVKVELLPGSDKGTMQVRALTGVRTVVGSVEIEYCSDVNAGVKPPRAIKVKRSQSET